MKCTHPHCRTKAEYYHRPTDNNWCQKHWEQYCEDATDIMEEQK